MTEASIGRLEMQLGRLLQTGVLVSAACLAVGLILWMSGAYRGVATAVLTTGFGAAVYARLPATRLELQAITHGFARVELFTQSEASQQNLDRLAAAGDLKHFRYLHFATHGLLDAAHPSRSGLLLYPSTPGSDGVLQMREILTLRLDADMVTLSACETGPAASSAAKAWSAWHARFSTPGPAASPSVSGTSTTLPPPR